MFADVLIGVLVLAVMAGLVATIVVGARRQRAARGSAFRAAADRLNVEYLPNDDGRVQELADGLGEFARFRSSSLGRLVPSNVIYDNASDMRMVAFVHGTRSDDDGQSRQWYVAIVEREDVPMCPGIVRLRDRRVRRVREGRSDRHQLAFTDDPAFADRFSADALLAESAHACVPARLRRVLLGLYDDVRFSFDVHLADRRTAVISADRNADLDADDVVRMVDVARAIAGARASS